MQNFNPNGVGVKGSLFGLPYSIEQASTVLIPVPWEVTVSYQAGCAAGIQALVDASPQLDLLDADLPEAWNYGIALDAPKPQIEALNEQLRPIAALYIQWEESGNAPDKSILHYNNSEVKAKEVPSMVNQASKQVNMLVRERAAQLLAQGKLVGVLGGDHSTPLGLMQALAEKYADFGILQIDAHADLRVAYEKFEFSHASIMYNALRISEISKLVQVGIRDYCEDEFHLIQNAQNRIVTFFDRDLKYEQYSGTTWHNQCLKIIHTLPQNVYVSFDIDGLDPKLCPNTGTPVAGGFEFAQTNYLLKLLVESGRKIIGFDLCEVGNNEWDGNVGARVLYKLCNLARLSWLNNKP